MQPSASAETDAANGHGSPALSRGAFWGLTFGSIGVVYGDIGTSPLYALRVAVLAAGGEHGIVTQAAVFGVLSLIFWSLLIVVTMKYVLILLRADNNGEGGTLALTALAFTAVGRRTPLVLALGILGASMFYGSTLITPALSVLSAIEGLNVATDAFAPYVLPLTVIILVALFSVQSHGTARVSTYFAPITTVWFLVLAVAGAVEIADNPRVLEALNPYYGIEFLMTHGIIGLVTLGAVFLVVTGSEALYNDLGHFGRRPIQTAWIYLVLPALLLNYFGQGALVLAHPETIANPFYLLFPEWALYPMVALATMATAIASQAVITGAYSITRQAMQLGLLPRMEVRHTSESQPGQIYMPRVNWLLLAGVLMLVFMFRSSSELASAYVLAVATTEWTAGILGFIVIWKLWRWKLVWVIAVMAPLIFIDTAFVMASTLKLVEGAWLPVLVGMMLIAVMITWRRGTRLLAQKTRRVEVPFEPLIKSLEERPPHIVPGTAVFLTADPDFAPTALLHNLKHNKVLHEQNVILTIVNEDIPRVKTENRVQMETMSDKFMRLNLHFGFVERPNVPKALAIARKQGWQFDIMSTSFFLSRRSVRPDVRSGMPPWQDQLYIFLAHNANDASSYFQLPTDRVVEIGTQVTV
ncbi:potassium transport protein Kup [Methyloceanibacter superfactus]|uniref:Probable potassium transport system protein Kup n=1 Tax=Methyloceanibacter superfactus TaxID=1774969 RepID=A0A1E3W4E6_9HYPH|nr:potassium transporter Kup [Methyloceanibacter superfactus]ODS00656.1 potassium transport protein Kup [Methyloceanibacter superfactus]